MLIRRRIRPGGIALLAGIGNSMKDPPETAGVNVISPNMTRGRSSLLGYPVSDNEEILIDDARRRTGDIEVFYIPAKIMVQIDHPVFTKRRDRASRQGIDAIQRRSGGIEQSLVFRTATIPGYPPAGTDGNFLDGAPVRPGRVEA